MVINWSNIAIQDLKNFKEITKMVDPEKYIINLVKYVDFLSDNPKLGRIYFYTNKYIIRQLIYNQHRIFYYIDNNVINIITIVHHKQNIKQKIKYIKNFFSEK